MEARAEQEDAVAAGAEELAGQEPYGDEGGKRICWSWCHLSRDH